MNKRVFIEWWCISNTILLMVLMTTVLLYNITSNPTFLKYTVFTAYVAGAYFVITAIVSTFLKE